MRFFEQVAFWRCSSWAERRRPPAVSSQQQQQHHLFLRFSPRWHCKHRIFVIIYRFGSFAFLLISHVSLNLWQCCVQAQHFNTCVQLRAFYFPARNSILVHRKTVTKYYKRGCCRLLRWSQTFYCSFLGFFPLKAQAIPSFESFSPPAGAPGPDTHSSEPSHILIRAFGVLETMSPRDYCQRQPRYYRITVRQSDSWRCPDNYSAAWISVEKLPCRENLSPRDAEERGSGGGWCGEETQRGSEGGWSLSIREFLSGGTFISAHCLDSGKKKWGLLVSTPQSEPWLQLRLCSPGLGKHQLSLRTKVKHARLLLSAPSHKLWRSLVEVLMICTEFRPNSPLGVCRHLVVEITPYIKRLWQWLKGAVGGSVIPQIGHWRRYGCFYYHYYCYYSK